MTFNETGLKPEILKAIAEMGFENPTPIQEQTIPHLLSSSQDLIALAQTGTGKTAAFGLPLLNNISMQAKQIQALILCPTRELCLQITRDIDNFSKYMAGFKTIAVYGGADIAKQIRELKAGGHIVVGTPGRVNDLIRRKVLNISAIRWLVLDEADEMLTMGFKDELDAILATTPDEKQTLLFSATMPTEIEDIASKHLHNPVQLSVGRRNEGAANVEHHYYVVHAKDKYATLKRIADNYPDCYAIVFCRTRQETREVADQFMADGYNADALHGDLSQAQRDTVMSRFRGRQLQMLIATDVAARGLDVNDLSHVINYSLPDDPEIYIHRSGRTGRAGKSGISVSIIHMKETGKLKQIERILHKKFERKMVPGGDEICEKQMFNLIERVVNVDVDENRISKFLSPILEKFDGMSKEDIVKHFVSLEFNKLMEYYKNAKDLNITIDTPRDQLKKKERGSDNRLKFSRLFINAGKKQGISALELIGLINECSKRRNIEIGKIDIQRKFSFFEIDSYFEKEVINAMNNQMFKGLQINVGKAESNGPESQSYNGGFRKDRNDNSYNGRRSFTRKDNYFHDHDDRKKKKKEFK